MNRTTIVVLFALASVGAACEEATDGDVNLLSGLVVAGPTCPVVREPPDPACDDRPVPGAEIVIVDASGTEVVRTRSGPDGEFQAMLPAGEYELVPQPVDGLLGTPGASAIVVRDGEDPAPVTIAYDTGIR